MAPGWWVLAERQFDSVRLPGANSCAGDKYRPAGHALARNSDSGRRLVETRPELAFWRLPSDSNRQPPFAARASPPTWQLRMQPEIDPRIGHNERNANPSPQS